MIIFGLVFLFVYAALVLYIGWSGWGWMKSVVKKEISRKFKVLYIVTFTIVSSSFVIGRFFDNIIFHIIGSFWMALFYLLVIIVPLVHISVLLLRLTRLPRPNIDKWSSIMAMGLVFSLVGYGLFNAYSPTVQTYDIQIEKSNPSTEQLNIVMASDTHFGVLSGKRHAIRMVKEINALEPDLVLFPGDILDDDINQFIEKEIAQVLAQIKAPDGVYLSLGNHDRHNGPIEDLIDTLEIGNLHVLYDDVITINDSITLIGRRDRTNSERLELGAFTEGMDLSKTVILLEHQPYDLDIAQEHGIDLMLSGHTHRGQVFPGNLITKRIYENDWGLLQKEQMYSIVSSGYGFWGPPIRIGSRSEIVQINVSFQEESNM
ncbi:metallophosphoesterase [Sutcliffiella halmapala]|uniref:metallophosphoesterase n=1 Tax=Sutcliffiella halmapala TaxID=79882 RepID=UPI001F33C206|nr:metallophosphoesterase [Sutcliffiella halmapala]